PPHRPDRDRDLHADVRADVRRRGGLRVMSPLDPEVPPAGEEIHLPGPSVLPVLTAVGITLVLVGLTTIPVLSIIGGLLTIYTVARWIKETRSAIDELPLDVRDS